MGWESENGITRPDRIQSDENTFIPPAPVIPTEPAETTHFQIIFTLHDVAGQMYRHGTPTQDNLTVDSALTELRARYDVKEIFVCTVHAAYVSETSFTQVI